MASQCKYELRVGIVSIDGKTHGNIEKISSETDSESIPTYLPHTPILHPRAGAAENKESMKMAEKKKTNQSDDEVKASRKRKLENNETPAEKKAKTMSETGNESIPTPVSQTLILHSKGEVPENKERIKMAEKSWTNQSDDAVKVSHERKLENNEKTAEKTETCNESIPTPLSHTPILNHRGEASENKETIKMSKRTNERDGNDVNTLSHTLELENNEKRDEKSSNESIPTPLSSTFLFIAEKIEIIEISEEKATNKSDDEITVNLSCELENNKKTAEQKANTSETGNESIPTILSHTPILHPRGGAAENKESIQMAQKKRTNHSDDAVKVSCKRKLENNETPTRKKEKMLETIKEFIPTPLSHTSILHPRNGAAENKESLKMAEKKRTNLSNDVVKESHKRKLETNETPTKKKEKMLETKEFTLTPLSYTSILHPRSGAAENKESLKMAEKKRTNHTDDAVKASRKQKLENNETPTKKKEKMLETVKEFIPTPLSHTSILHPRSRAAENKESLKMAEKKRTNHTDDAVKASRKQKLENNETPTKKKEKMLETVKEFTPTPLSHTSILHPRSGAAENKESLKMAEKRRTNHTDDAVKASRKRKLENNETPTKKKSKTALEIAKESITAPLSYTSTLRPRDRAAENKESIKLAEKKKTNQSNDVDKASRKRKLENNETSTEKKEKKLEIAKASYPTPLFHTPLVCPRGEATENKDRIKPAEIKRSNQSNDVVKASCKQASENNEKPTEKNDSSPTQLSHTCLKNLRCIEKRLVYSDEEDISFEFAEAVASTSTQSARCDSGNAGPSMAPHGRALPCISKRFQLALNQARACYSHKNYGGAMEQLSTALELFSKGTSIENPLEASADDISSIASFIETKLAMCCLKMKRPSDALTHAHRSIIKNPAYFQNHMRQAAAFRSLGRYSEAARSAMIADYIYCLTGGTRKRTSKYIRYYWQAMIEEAITAETSFTVMYTPFETEEKDHNIDKIQRTFAKRNPDYLQYKYTDPRGFHILPQSAKWPSEPPGLHLLTLGFKSKTVGKLVEKWTSRRLSMLSDQKALFNTLMDKEAEKYWKIIGQKVMTAMDFIRSTKLTDDRCPCSRAIEKLQQANLFGRMQNLQEQAQLLEQVMAELATIPYLQDISEEDIKLLELLMADAMDTLGGRTDNQRVWNEIRKIGLIEGYLYEVEDNYIKNKKLNKARTERRKKIQSLQQAQRPGSAPGRAPGSIPQIPLGRAPGSIPQIPLGRAPGSIPQIPPGRAPGSTPQIPLGRAPGSIPQIPLGRAPGSTPRSAPGRAPQSIPGRAPGNTPQSTPRSAPGSIPQIPPGSIRQITPGTTPGKAPGSKPQSTPRSAPGTAPGRAPQSTLGRAPGSTPQSAPGTIPGRAPGTTPGRAPRSTPQSAPGTIPGRAPGTTPGRAPGSTPLRAPQSTPQSPPGRAAGSTPGRAPGNTPQSTSERAPGSTPQSPPGRAPGSTPQSTPGRAPGNTPRSTPGRAPGSTPQSPPGRAPGSTPQSTPGRAAGSTPRSTPGRAPGSTPQRPAGRAPGSTPQSTPQSAAGSTPQRTPRRKVGSTPQSRPQRTPGSKPRSTAGIAPALLSLIRPCSIVLEQLRGLPPHT